MPKGAISGLLAQSPCYRWYGEYIPHFQIRPLIQLDYNYSTKQLTLT